MPNYILTDEEDQVLGAGYFKTPEGCLKEFEDQIGAGASFVIVYEVTGKFMYKTKLTTTRVYEKQYGEKPEGGKNNAIS